MSNLALMVSHDSDNKEDEVIDEKLMIIMHKKQLMNHLMNVKFYTKPCQLKRNKFHLLKKRLTQCKKQFDKEKLNYFEKEKPNFTCNESSSLSFKIV